MNSEARLCAAYIRTRTKQHTQHIPRSNRIFRSPSNVKCPSSTPKPPSQILRISQSYSQHAAVCAALCIGSAFDARHVAAGAVQGAHHTGPCSNRILGVCCTLAPQIMCRSVMKLGDTTTTTKSTCFSVSLSRDKAREWCGPSAIGECGGGGCGDGVLMVDAGT